MSRNRTVSVGGGRIAVPGSPQIVKWPCTTIYACPWKVGEFKGVSVPIHICLRDEQIAEPAIFHQLPGEQTKNRVLGPRPAIVFLFLM